MAVLVPPSRLMGWLLVLMTTVAYLPAFQAGFIFDDDVHVTGNLALRSLNGLGQIWSQPSATPQYYPLVHTSFWLEYHLWGLNPAGYHVINVLLHALAAVLLWRALVRLQVPGSWLAAGIFALHPVAVESVAWVTERKNVLSAVFYFAAALVWWRWDDPVMPDERAGSQDGKVRPARGWYFLALALFLAALLSKTVTCSLPAALLLVSWWKRGRLELREFGSLLPFFVVGAGLALVTSRLEHTQVGASGPEWAFNLPDRCLIAGRALCFYAGKLCWPAHLTYIYPRWQVNAGVWWQWLFPTAVLAVMGLLWGLRRRLGRGPLVAVLFFAGTLLPALGFSNIYFMRYSLVADHFQYLAGTGLIVLAAAGLANGRRPVPSLGAPGQSAWPSWRAAAVVGLLLTLGTLTWRQCGMYAGPETLWETTLQRNPRAWMAHDNLGEFLMQQGREDEAVAHWKQAIKVKPDDAVAYYNLGMAASQSGRVAEAIAFYQQALDLDPNQVEADNKLAWILATSPLPALRNGPRAVALAQHANQLARGRNPGVLGTLAAALAEAGRFPEAVAALRQALPLAAARNETAQVEDLQMELNFYQTNALFRDLSLTNNSLTH
jgi:tetratricopeptide (TPR) repeat protein